VEKRFKTVTGPTIAKLSENTYRISGDFGSFVYFGGEYQVKDVYLKSPGDNQVLVSDQVLRIEVLSGTTDRWEESKWHEDCVGGAVGGN
jgi:hypothetical protein